MTNATATKETKKEDEKARDYAMVAVSVPLDLFASLESSAKEAKVGIGVLVRRFVAQVMNYDIAQFERSRRRGRVSGLSEEERKAQNAKAQADRAALVRLLMQKYKSGDLEIDEAAIAAEAAKAVSRPRKPKAGEAARATTN